MVHAENTKIHQYPPTNPYIYDTIPLDLIKVNAGKFIETYWASDKNKIIIFILQVFVAME